MSTTREDCPLCLIQKASVSPVTFPGGEVLAGVRSFRCPYCQSYIVHDAARPLLVGLDGETRKALSLEARRRENAGEPRFEITPEVIDASRAKARMFCPECGHGLNAHPPSENVNDEIPVGSIGGVGERPKPGPCIEPRCGCQGGWKALTPPA